ncbi:MAG: hypothetical protein IPQ18_09820 [Saprospiraceae bacterium]|nr:hypothetical protein [Saprospiraceae bacterium]
MKVHVQGACSRGFKSSHNRHTTATRSSLALFFLTKKQPNGNSFNPRGDEEGISKALALICQRVYDLVLNAGTASDLEAFSKD